MVHGYHLILGAYGFWLPNDPRGSWSDFVGKWELARFGKTTRSAERRRLEELSEVELSEREAARRSLKYPAVQFTGVQALGIGQGFAAVSQTAKYTIWRCAILPEHTHLVVARHQYEIEKIANLLKGGATRELRRTNLHPLSRFAKPGERPPRMWAEHEWKVYLDSEESIENAIQYVSENPVKEGKPSQAWSFVTPFQGLSRGGWVTYH